MNLISCHEKLSPLLLLLLERVQQSSSERTHTPSSTVTHTDFIFSGFKTESSRTFAGLHSCFLLLVDMDSLVFGSSFDFFCMLKALWCFWWTKFIYLLVLTGSFTPQMAKNTFVAIKHSIFTFKKHESVNLKCFQLWILRPKSRF